MLIPAYMWLKDDKGVHVKGSVDIQGIEDSIEIKGFSLNRSLPEEAMSGKLTGSKTNASMIIRKDPDQSSSYINDVVATGKVLKSAEIKWFSTNDKGQQVEYFNMLLEGIKIAEMSPKMHVSENEKDNQQECIQLDYEKLTWKHCDNNFLFSDGWND